VVRVLYVAGERADADRVAADLERAWPGLSVVTATSVAEAAAALDESAIDCVVSAFDPAAERGRDLLRVVRETAPAVPQAVAWDLDADPPGVAALVDRIEATVGPVEADAASRPDGTTDSVLDAVPGVACLVAADGAIRRWNAATAAVTDDATVAGTPFATLVADEDRDRVASALTTALEDGRAVVEAPLETAAGERHPHAWTVTRIGDDLLGVVGRDRTELAALRTELEEVEVSLAALYETLSDRESTFESRLDRILELGCDRLDLEYGFLTRITGETQEIVAARGTHPKLQPDEQCPLSEAYCRQAIRGEGLLGVVDAAAEGWEDDPAYEAFGLGCYLGGEVTLDDGLYGTLCFAGDDPRAETFTEAERTFVELLTRWVSYELDQRAVNEELERQNDRLSEFASIVSHDLRNPLSVAAGRLELARETGADRHLVEVEEALERMERLVTGLLELARQGSVIDSVTTVELADVSEVAWRNVATDDAELVVEASGSIAADRDRLLQLFENLFRNAVEHGATSPRNESGDAVEHGTTSPRNESGDAVEHGTTSPRNESGDAVETHTLTVRVGELDDGFFVADSGRGVAPDQREAVFERGHSTNDGTGLGLTLVRAVADAHGWTTTLETSESGGARFSFTGVDRPAP
jgi:signal transduction histidine kinase